MGVGSLSLLQQIFATQESNRSLLHCRQILYQLSYEGSPIYSQGNTNCQQPQKHILLTWDLIEAKGCLTWKWENTKWPKDILWNMQQDNLRTTAKNEAASFTIAGEWTPGVPGEITGGAEAACPLWTLNLTHESSLLQYKSTLRRSKKGKASREKLKESKHPRKQATIYIYIIFFNTRHKHTGRRKSSVTLAS